MADDSVRIVPIPGVQGAQLHAAWQLGMDDYRMGTDRNLVALLVAVTGSDATLYDNPDHADRIRIAYSHGRLTGVDIARRDATIARVKARNN